MERIDTSGWKEFWLRDLFEFKLPQGDLQVKQVEDGDIPLITPSAFNNGLLQRVSADSNSTLFSANTLTVDMFGNAYYQEEEYYVTAHGHVNVLLPKILLNKNNGMFIATAIRSMFLKKYGFSEMCTQKVLNNEKVKLPVTADGKPDYAYMDQYMRDVTKEAEASIENLRRADKTKETIDIHSWKRFHLYDEGLFDIDMGTKLDRVKMTRIKPEINFVGRANTNNGITGRVDRLADVQPYEAGNLTLSLGGEYLGSCFIQPDAFYTSQNVVVLLPKWDMPFSVKQFVATMIFRESRTYYKAFIDELNRHIKTDFSFFLPVLSDGNPDWNYMDTYMSEMLETTSAHLNILAEVAS